MKNLPKLDDWCLRLNNSKMSIVFNCLMLWWKSWSCTMWFGRFDSFYKKESYQIISMDSGISSETSIEILRSVHRINSGPTTTHHVGCSFPPSGKSTKNTSPTCWTLNDLTKKRTRICWDELSKNQLDMFFSQVVFFSQAFLGWNYWMIWLYPILSKMSDLFLGVKKVTTMQPPGAVSAR